MSRYLGIDQSFTSTGVVIIDTEYNIVHSAVIRTDKNTNFCERVHTIYQQIFELAERYGVRHIACEGLAYGMVGNATRDLAGLQVYIRTRFLADAGIDVAEYSPSAIKKQATGNGRASKTDMAAALPPRIAASFADAGYKASTGLYDLTDAYFIGRYHAQHLMRRLR